MISGEKTKLSFLLYNLTLRDSIISRQRYKRIKHVKNILNQLRITDIGITQHCSSIPLHIHHGEVRQNDQYLQQLNSDIAASSSENTCTIFKEYVTLGIYQITTNIKDVHNVRH